MGNIIIHAFDIAFSEFIFSFSSLKIIPPTLKLIRKLIKSTIKIKKVKLYLTTTDLFSLCNFSYFFFDNIDIFSNIF